MGKDLKQIENDLVEAIRDGLADDIQAIQQPRSNFALEHFVVATHDTPGRQRIQCVLELQIKMFNIRRAQLEERKLLVQRNQQQELAKRGVDQYAKALAAIEVERIDVDLADMSLARLGAVREAQCLLAILAKLPKYTYEQLQQEEVAYWYARLSRQALTDLKSMGTIGAGNVEAIHQMLRKVGEPGHSLPLEDLKSIVSLSAPEPMEIPPPAMPE